MLPLLFPSLVLAADPPSIEEVMDLAAERSVGPQGAAIDVRSAEADMLATEAPFDTQLRAEAGWTSSTRESAGQLGRVFAETGGWTTGLGAERSFLTGTSVALDLSATQNRFLFRLPDAGREVTDTPQYQSSLALRVAQQLLDGAGAAWNARAQRAARDVRDAAKLQRTAQVARARAEAARAYRAVAVAGVALSLAEEARASAEAQAEVVRAGVAEGRLARVEQTRAELARLEAAQEGVRAEAAHADAADALGRVLGTPGERLRGVKLPAARCESAPDPDSLLEEARRTSPELAAARLRVQSAKDARAVARRSLLPALRADASVGFVGFEASVGDSFAELSSGALPDWSVGGRLQVPLHNRADRAALSRAEADLARAQLQLRDAEDALAQALRAQVRAVALAGAGLERSEALGALAAEALAVEEARLTEGRGLVRDVTEARRAKVAAELTRAQDLATCGDALGEIARLLGR